MRPGSLRDRPQSAVGNERAARSGHAPVPQTHTAPRARPQSQARPSAPLVAHRGRTRKCPLLRFISGGLIGSHLRPVLSWRWSASRTSKATRRTRRRAPVAARVCAAPAPPHSKAARGDTSGQRHRRFRCNGSLFQVSLALCKIRPSTKARSRSIELHPGLLGRGERLGVSPRPAPKAAPPHAGQALLQPSPEVAQAQDRQDGCHGNHEEGH